jgi:hypothetical protein
MSAFPEGLATDATEQIMESIKGHLKEEPPPLENQHYNRVYEKVWAVVDATLRRPVVKETR